MTRYDVAVAGAGIAGASLAAALAPHARVLLLEAEDMPGRHATGRSAAFWSETYGGPLIQPLTTASREVLEPFLKPLGSLHIGRAGDEALVDGFMAEFSGSAVDLSRVDPSARILCLRPEWTLGVWEPSCAYIDVAGLHAHYLAEAKRHGAALVCDAGVRAAERRDGTWRIGTPAGDFRADLLVNAAGAWADTVAERARIRPLGIKSYRRTMVQLRTDPSAPAGLPHVTDIAGRFYFKPEAGGRLWLSPHDEIAADPCDAAPDELDVATAVDRFEHVVDWRVEAVERRWAGLRTFAPDRLPIYGFAEPSFFWCAAQGGFGIQTAPAAAALAAGLIFGRNADLPRVDAARYAPDRFTTGSTLTI